MRSSTHLCSLHLSAGRPQSVPSLQVPWFPRLPEHRLAPCLAHDSCSWNMGTGDKTIGATNSNRNGSQSLSPEPAILSQPGDLSEMQILRPHSRLTDSESLRLEPKKACSSKPSKRIWHLLTLESHHVRTWLSIRTGGSVTSLLLLGASRRSQSFAYCD